MVAGEAGVGKTRLVTEFADRVRREARAPSPDLTGHLAGAAPGHRRPGGLGGGGAAAAGRAGRRPVTSPNVTLTLEAVPARMAGAVGGALQTATRIGSAVGTALLASIFYRILTGSGHAYPKAVSEALLCACG